MEIIENKAEACQIVAEYARRVSRAIPSEKKELMVILEAVKMMKMSMSRTVIMQDLGLKIAGGPGKGNIANQYLANLLHENMDIGMATEASLGMFADRAPVQIVDGKELPAEPKEDGSPPPEQDVPPAPPAALDTMNQKQLRAEAKKLDPPLKFKAGITNKQMVAAIKARQK